MQQQGMVGSHGMMANQAGMVSSGGCDGYAFFFIIKGHLFHKPLNSCLFIHETFPDLFLYI